MHSDDDWDSDPEDDGYIPCHYCGNPMYEESGYCPSCDRWQSQEDRSQKKLPAWVLLTALCLLAVFVYSALRSF